MTLRGQHLVEAVVEAVADCYGFTPSQLLGRSRTRPVVEARHLAMYTAHEYARWSYPMLGQVFGQRDHTTVVSACQRVARDPDLVGLAEQLWDKLGIMNTGGNGHREGVG